MTDKLPFSLTGKIAAVTGLGSPADELSNGSAIARLFARQGAVIEGLDINAKDAQTTIKKQSRQRADAFFTSGDATDEQAVNNWMQVILDRHGRIDILINNVGQSERLGPADADTNIWRDQLALNLDSVMFCTRAAITPPKPRDDRCQERRDWSTSHQWRNAMPGIRHLG